MTHNLSLGIYLEDIGELLPWGTPLGELYNIANPIVQKGRDVIRLYWNNHSILGGIKSQIEASFYMNRPDLLDFPNAKGTLEMVSLNFYNSEQIHARQQHQQLKDKFIRALGKPSFDGMGEAPFSDLPYTEWDLDDVLVVLKVFERFGEYCVGKIWHKPLPAWRAKTLSKSDES
ncbi:MAG: hypothetical protein GXO36_02670 [Chloroflexi bacterium]|nr:hypothetical protein [Chloroflexota bacterium]